MTTCDMHILNNASKAICTAIDDYAAEMLHFTDVDRAAVEGCSAQVEFNGAEKGWSRYIYEKCDREGFQMYKQQQQMTEHKVRVISTIRRLLRGTFDLVLFLDPVSMQFSQSTESNFALCDAQQALSSNKSVGD